MYRRFGGIGNFTDMIFIIQARSRAAALVKEGGAALLAWGGRGEEVIPG